MKVKATHKIEAELDSDEKKQLTTFCELFDLGPEHIQMIKEMAHSSLYESKTLTDVIKYILFSAWGMNVFTHYCDSHLDVSEGVLYCKTCKKDVTRFVDRCKHNDYFVVKLAGKEFPAEMGSLLCY